MNKVLNFTLFQIGWFACVLGGAYGLPWVGTLMAMGIVTFYLLKATHPLGELRLFAVAALIGLVYDSALVSAGWLSYPSGYFHTNLAPHWIIAMWPLFATTLNSSLAWLQNRPMVAVLFGAIAGPLAYLGGAALGGVIFIQRDAALLALAAGWAVWLPLLLQLARHTARPAMALRTAGDSHHV